MKNSYLHSWRWFHLNNLRDHNHNLHHKGNEQGYNDQTHK